MRIVLVTQEEDKHTLRDLVLLAMSFRLISYEWGQELLKDLEEQEEE